MRILIFATHFHPYRGGLENYAIELAKRLLKKGIKIDVLTFNTNDLQDYEIYRGIHIYRISCWHVLKQVYSIPRFDKKTKGILKKLSAEKYDFVITNTRFFASSWLGMKFAKKNKIKYMHIEHGNTFVQHKNPIVTFCAWLYDMTFGKIIFRNADIVVGISKPCVDFAKKMGARKTVLIHNSIDTEFFRKRNPKKLKIKVKNNEKVIAFVGRLIFAKGCQDLIKAVEGMKKIKLIIVGDGPYMNELKKLAKKLNVNALFLGNKSQDEIIDVLSISDIFVNPSFSEGLPTSVLEAGSVGVPIIATDVGGTGEIIKNMESGILIEPKNPDLLKEKIELMLKNRKLAGKLGKNASAFIRKNFEWKKNIDKMVKVLKS